MSEPSAGYSPIVVLESPFAGDVERNTHYARLALADSIARGECPIAGHLLYTQVLDDNEPDARAQGIALHMRWLDFADYVVAYVDLGISRGMEQALAEARSRGLTIEIRRLGVFAN